MHIPSERKSLMPEILVAFILAGLLVVVGLFNPISKTEVSTVENAGALKEDAGQKEKFFSKYEEDLRNFKWQAAEVDRDAGWFEKYEANTKNMYLRVAYGKTEKGEKKLIIVAIFDRETPTHYYYQQYLNGEPGASNYKNTSVFPHVMIQWLVEKDAFRIVDGLPSHIVEEIINAADSTIEEDRLIYRR